MVKEDKPKFKVNYVSPELTPDKILNIVWSNGPIIVNKKLFEEKETKNAKRR